MSDLLDNAHRLEEFNRNLAFKNHTAKSAKPNAEIVTDVRNGKCVRVCAECDDEIPERRIVALPDAVLCVECQEVWEKHL